MNEYRVIVSKTIQVQFIMVVLAENEEEAQDIADTEVNILDIDTDVKTSMEFKTKEWQQIHFIERVN